MRELYTLMGECRPSWVNMIEESRDAIQDQGSDCTLKNGLAGSSEKKDHPLQVRRYGGLGKGPLL